MGACSFCCGVRKTVWVSHYEIEMGYCFESFFSIFLGSFCRREYVLGYFFFLNSSTVICWERLAVWGDLNKRNRPFMRFCHATKKPNSFGAGKDVFVVKDKMTSKDLQTVTSMESEK